jgi:hypothetical protein
MVSMGIFAQPRRAVRHVEPNLVKMWQKSDEMTHLPGTDAVAEMTSGHFDALYLQRKR